MNKILASLITGVCLVTVGALAPVAWAKNPHGDPPGHSKKEKKKKKSKQEAGAVYLGPAQVGIVQRFYDTHPGALPPGLAKRRGKLPPGLAKRHTLPPGLRRNQIISTEIELVPLPPSLTVKLPPLPHEVMYALVGRDLLIVDKKTRKLIDVMRDTIPLPPLP